MASTPDGIVRILVSYWYWKSRDLQALVDLAGDLPVRLFADSGAYSAHTLQSGGVTINISDYSAWLNDWKHLITVAANLDVIGDPRATARNQFQLEQWGHEVIPVFHGSSSLAELEALCRDYRYVAVGGTASLHGRRAAMIAYTAQMMLIAQQYGTVFHGFGRSSSADLASLPFYSADSTTWMQGARYGHLQVFTGRGLKMMSIQTAAKNPVLLRKHGVNPQLLHAGYVTGGRRRPLEEYRREQHESLFAASVAWKRFEAYLRDRHKVPAPPGQPDPGPVVYFADDVIRHLQQMMRAVRWLAGEETHA